MRVLVACEYSGIVRRAFSERGCHAWSCDLLPAEDGGPHYQCDVREVLSEGWDLIIAHPPCTRLANSGVRWLNRPPAGRTVPQMWEELDLGCELFTACLNAPARRVAVENPVMHKHAKAKIRGYFPPTQTIQPWQYGHGETKRTCLWLRGLPPLTPTNIVKGREAIVHRMSPGPERGKERSRFYSGIAAAMAEQWLTE